MIWTWTEHQLDDGMIDAFCGLVVGAVRWHSSVKKMRPGVFGHEPCLVSVSWRSSWTFLPSVLGSVIKIDATTFLAI